MGLQMAITDERLQIWLNFWKVVLVSGVVAMVAIVAPPLINSQIQQKELAIKENEQKMQLEMARNKADAEVRQAIVNQETKYVDTFFERATTENLETRFRYTQYFSALTRDAEYKKGWDVLLAAVREERKIVQDRLLKAEQDASKTSGSELHALQAEIARLKRDLDARARNTPSYTPTTMRYRDIAEKAPCPADTEAVISVFADLKELTDISFFTPEPPDPIRDAVRRALTTDSPFRVFRTIDPLRFFPLFDTTRSSPLVTVRHCINKENHVVGTGVFFNSNGQPIKL
jgi:hypothetical protein